MKFFVPLFLQRLFSLHGSLLSFQLYSKQEKGKKTYISLYVDFLYLEYYLRRNWFDTTSKDRGINSIYDHSFRTHNRYIGDRSPQLPHRLPLPSLPSSYPGSLSMLLNWLYKKLPANRSDCTLTLH